MEKRKIKMSIFVLSCVVISACILYACVNDTIGESTDESDSPSELITGKNTELTIAVAQQWYNANHKPVSELRSSNDRVGKLVMPWWEKAKERKRGKRYEVVEIPLKTQRSSIFMDKETRERVNWETDEGKIRNIVRMVIQKDLKTGCTRNFIMVFIGSYDYLMKSKTFGKNSYLHREPDFDGSVLFFEPGRGLLNGWLYRNGKIKREIFPNPEKDNRPIQLRIQTCWTEYSYYEYEVCIQWGDQEWDAEYGWVAVINLGCYTESISIERTVCEDEDHQDDHWNGGGNGGGASGGGSGPVSAVLYANNLDRTGRGNLDNIMDVMLEQCGYKSMYDYLKRYNYKISSVSISNEGVGEYDPSNKSIRFGGNELISNAFPEEFIHFFQDYYYPNGIGVYNNSGRSNIEFEAKLIVDILCLMRGMGCAYIGTGYQNPYSSGYGSWLELITNGGTTIPEYDDLMSRSYTGLNYWDFLDDFREHSPDYDYPVDPTLDPKVLRFLYNNACKE